MPQQKIENLIIHEKPRRYVIDIMLEGEKEYRTVGAAWASPVGQCIRLLQRLLLLSDRIAGYNQ